jgi:cation diffusion facilitator CzcD-associated flavoprotein CzcO
MMHYSIAIIGAGPYGLAIGAKLSSAGANFVILGRPMGFWRENVPVGTRLLSTRSSCSLSGDGFDYQTYTRDTGLNPQTFTSQDLVDYGLWFQRRTYLETDERVVSHLSRIDRIFHIRLESGEDISAERVVTAVGLKPFAYVPAEFAELRGRSVFHTSDLHDLNVFSGKNVVVIGSLQSAIDCAALLSERQADVEVLARTDEVRWQEGNTAPAAEPTMSRNWTLRGAMRDFMFAPRVFWQSPGFIRARELRWVMRPAADRRLVPRLNGVRFGLGRTVARASSTNGRVMLKLDDGTTRTVDHVVVGTGYRIDVNAIPFLSRELRSEIRAHAGYPVLNRKMESSAKGLYFIGATAAWSFGPLMWFIRGASLAAEIVREDLMRQS